jgi:hypothetical protein
LGCNEPFELAHHKKNYTLEAPQIRSFYWRMECLPLDEKEKNFGQNIWDKSVRTYWGTCWELGKPLGNRKKLKIFLFPPTQIWGP